MTEIRERNDGNDKNEGCRSWWGKKKRMHFITSNIGLKCSANWPSVSWWWITEQQQEERRKTGWEWLHGAIMKQTKWEFNYSTAIDSGCTDDGGKIPAILKWEHAVIEAAQKQTQRDFLPQQELTLLEELEKIKNKRKKKIKFPSSTTLIFEVEHSQCGAVFPQCAYGTTVATTLCLSAKSAHWQK